MVQKLTVHRHFINLGTVVLLNVSQNTNIIILHKVNGNTLTAISPRATNSAVKRMSVQYNVMCNYYLLTCECKVHGCLGDRS